MGWPTLESLGLAQGIQLGQMDRFVLSMTSLIRARHPAIRVARAWNRFLTLRHPPLIHASPQDRSRCASKVDRLQEPGYAEKSLWDPVLLWMIQPRQAPHSDALGDTLALCATLFPTRAEVTTTSPGCTVMTVNGQRPTENSVAAATGVGIDPVDATDAILGSTEVITTRSGRI